MKTKYGDEVNVETTDGDLLLSVFDGRWVQVWLTPRDALELSRALVSAAGEAMGLTRNPTHPALVGQREGGA